MKIFTAPRAWLFLLLSAGAPVAAGACGYPTFEFEPKGTGTTGTMVTGGGGIGGMGTGGGAMGTGGEATTSSVASSGTSASGTGGGPPACVITHKGMGTCEYLPGSECGCPDPTTKCAVIDEQTGKSGCIKIGATPKPAWSLCDSDNDCAAATWCDLDLHVCKPICNLASECPTPDAHCVPVPQSGVNTPIPSLKACTSHCDPESTTPCGAGLTCFQDSSNEFDCLRTNNKVEGAVCQFLDDCAKGLLCINSTKMPAVYTCETWCHEAGSFSGSCPLDKPFCYGFNTAVMYNGSTYGVCDVFPPP